MVGPANGGTLEDHEGKPKAAKVQLLNLFALHLQKAVAMFL